MPMTLLSQKVNYIPILAYTWEVKSELYSGEVDFDEICDTCDSVKDIKITELERRIKELEAEREELKARLERLEKTADFLRKELNSLELKTALSEKAVPLKEIVREFTSTPEGRKLWEKAWQERAVEWEKMVKEGKMSRIKFYRLLNGMDQATLAKKLGTSQPNISRLERVGYNVPVRTLKKLARIFNVEIKELIGE